jgi:hypothetical protein
MSQLDDEWASSGRSSLTLEQAMELAQAYQVHDDQPKLVAVIKNSLTEQEMHEAGKRWVNHKGPYMTVAQTLAYAAERAKQKSTQPKVN